MKINIDTRELDNLRKNIAGFSERRMNAVVATAMTRTVKNAQGRWRQRLTSDLDRPTTRTMNAASVTTARADNLEASVFLKGGAAGTPAEYLRPNLAGGSRFLKLFEQTLVEAGVMPAGYFTVPGQGATRDGYGNVSRGQIVAVIRALGEMYSPGYQQVISKTTARKLKSQARHGRKYIAVRPADASKAKVSPGVYERMADGSRKAIFLFKKTVTYKMLLHLADSTSVAELDRDLQQQTNRALQETLARLAAKGQT